MNSVHDQHISYIITKRVKPFAKLVPPSEEIPAMKGVPTQLVPLHPAIAVESCSLEDLYGDPADRIIVATARVENLTLITRDKKIQTYGEACKVKVISA